MTRPAIQRPQLPALDAQLFFFVIHAWLWESNTADLMRLWRPACQSNAQRGAPQGSSGIMLSRH
jgi:hypothetical protein